MYVREKKEENEGFMPMAVVAIIFVIGVETGWR